MTIPIEENSLDEANTTISVASDQRDEAEATAIIRPMLRSELQLQDTLEQAPKKARKVTQILAVVAVSVGAFIHGTTVSFPAVAIPSIKRSNLTNRTTEGDAFMPFHVSDNDISLIVSIASFGMLFGSLIAGPTANMIGRKWTTIFGTCGMLALGYALVAAAQYVWMMLLGRFLHGVGLGFSTTVSTLYIMEVTTPNMRGSLAVVPAIAGTLGLLTTQVLGAWLNWQWLSIVCASLNVPFFLMLIFIPESPVYLISTEQIDAAHKILRVLRGPKWDVTKELTDIKVASEGRETYHVRLQDFFTSVVLKPFLIALTLMFFFQFSGINVILQYTVDIFKLADISVDIFLATILVGIALLISNIITLLVANRMPRRLMLILSSLGISLALIGMGAYFYLKSLDRLACGHDRSSLNTNATASALSTDATEDEKENHDDKCPHYYTENIGWLPLVILMIYIFFFNLGYGAMIWITVVEILPLNVRSVATSLSVAFTCVCSFLTSHTYNDLKETINAEGVFWLYGGISLVGLFFIVAFVPETKGKNEAELRQFFQKKKKVYKSSPMQRKNEKRQ